MKRWTPGLSAPFISIPQSSEVWADRKAKLNIIHSLNFPGLCSYTRCFYNPLNKTPMSGIIQFESTLCRIWSWFAAVRHRHMYGVILEMNLHKTGPDLSHFPRDTADPGSVSLSHVVISLNLFLQQKIFFSPYRKPHPYLCSICSVN